MSSPVFIKIVFFLFNVFLTDIVIVFFLYFLQTEESVRRNSESEAGGAETPEHDPHYEPIVSLPLVDIQTNEEEEEELVKIRARLYRYDTGDHEWKVCT